MRINKIVPSSVVILLIAVVFAGAVAVPAAAQTTTAQPTTMMFRYNAQHTGDYSPVAGPVPSNGKLKWSCSTKYVIYGSPTVANGVVYFGSEDFNIYALNADTGTKLWSYPAGGGVESSPAVANGVVYVASGENLYALNAKTGAKLWSQPIEGQSSPTVVNGVVYVGSYDNNVYALNAKTGHKLWNYTTGSIVVSSPAVANGVVYVGSYDNNVYALNAKTGHKLWSFATGVNGVTSSPAVANGLVYVGGEGGWNAATHSFVNGDIYALNARTGAKVWDYYTTEGMVQSSPAVVNGVVYIGSNSHGNLYALNAKTGHKLWSFAAGNAFYSSPAVANGVVYVGNWDNNVYALNAKTGHKLWSFAAGGPVLSSPAVANGVVYVGSWGGNFPHQYGNFYAIGNRTTTLTASPSTSTPLARQSFTISGTLLSGNGGLPNAQVTLYRFTNNHAWTKVATTTTAAGSTPGEYTFSVTENAARTVYYKVAYAGNTTLNGSTAYVKVVVK
jgi:outer membrane protein assembly factor BamB